MTVKVWLGLFLVFLPETFTQITDNPRDQPHIAQTHLSTNCCPFLHSPSLLLACANQSAIITSKNPSIIAVSYSTEGILDYGAYSMAINTYYTQFHGYGMVLLTPDQGAEYEPRDQRWNKVKILIDALDPVTGWGKHSGFLIWLDSDLIFLDMGMKIEDIVQQYDSFDMIFSADADIENGIVNSGLFIVKNTKWSRDFLQTWWSSYDRVLGMDQHIFTRVWEKTPDVRDHILILRPDAINSHLPAWINQKEGNQILHLAGASNVLRKNVFQQGFKEICEKLANKSPLKRQLGLTKDVLRHIEKSLPRGEVVRQILQEMRAKSEKSVEIMEVRKLNSKLIDLLQMGFERPEEESDVSEKIIEGLRWSFHMYLNIASKNTGNLVAHLESIQLALDAMFNLLMRLDPSDAESLEILFRAEPLIESLLKSVRSEHYGPALYYKLKQRQFLAINFDQRGDRPNALKTYKEAMDVWWKMHELKSYGSGNGANDPYAEGCGILTDIAALSYLEGDTKTCLESIGHVVEFYREIWESREHIPIHVLKKHGTRLGMGGTCAMKSHENELALSYLTQTLKIYKFTLESDQLIRETEIAIAQVSQLLKNEQIPPPKVSLLSHIDGDGNGQQDPIVNSAHSNNRRVYRRKKLKGEGNR